MNHYIAFLVSFAVALIEGMVYAMGGGQGWAFMGVITMLGGLGFVYMAEQELNRKE